MVTVITRDKWDKARDIINLWLKDGTLYCNNCGSNYYEIAPICCEKPQVGKNIDHCYGLIRQNKELKQQSLNEFSSNKDNTMRFGASIPPRLYHTLDRYFRETYGHKLFNETGDLQTFCRKFPQFSIPERI